MEGPGNQGIESEEEKRVREIKELVDQGLTEEDAEFALDMADQSKFQEGGLGKNNLIEAIQPRDLIAQQDINEYPITTPQSDFVAERIRFNLNYVADPNIERIITEFEELTVEFEKDHPLEKLHAITELEPVVEPYVTETRKFQKDDIRYPAIKALWPIRLRFEILKGSSYNMPSGKYDYLMERFDKITKAVGVANTITGKVDHTRRG